LDLPLETPVVIAKYSEFLTSYEKIEIADYNKIYYFGKDA